MLTLPNTVSPRQEMLAYETLWSIRNQSVKSIADLYRKDPGFPSQLLRLRKSESFILDDLSDAVQNYMQNVTGFSVCIHGTELYPEQLRSAQHPLELFYYKGDIGLTKTQCLSIVGARKASPDGMRRAARLAKELSQEGFTIVSGLAEGIDTAAMQSTLDHHGRLIGVVGTPINEYYPKENRSLQDVVANKHLLISHVPFYRYKEEPFEARRRHFPERNETMAAISAATIIVEASETSGTHSQARACLTKGKPLFILESCFHNPKITWPDKYLNKGAIRIAESKQILAALSLGEKSNHH